MEDQRHSGGLVGSEEAKPSAALSVFERGARGLVLGRLGVRTILQ